MGPIVAALNDRIDNVSLVADGNALLHRIGNDHAIQTDKTEYSSHEHVRTGVVVRVHQDDFGK
jgi:hypothetical protein